MNASSGREICSLFLVYGEIQFYFKGKLYEVGEFTEYLTRRTPPVWKYILISVYL